MEIYIEIVAFAVYYLRACIVLWVTRPLGYYEELPGRVGG